MQPSRPPRSAGTRAGSPATLLRCTPATIVPSDGNNLLSKASDVMQNGPAFQQGLSILFESCVSLTRDYVSRTGAFLALSDFVLDALAFVERCIAIRLDFRVVHKQVIAAIIRGNETIPLIRVEPLYNTCTHLRFSLAFSRADQLVPLIIGFPEAHL